MEPKQEDCIVKDSATEDNTVSEKSVQMEEEINDSSTVVIVSSSSTKSTEKQNISNSVQNKPKPSPGSAFTWSKFKSSKMSNAAGTKGKVNSSFKKVVSEPCLSNYFSSKSKGSDSEKSFKCTELSSISPLRPVESCAEATGTEDSLSQVSSVSLSQASSVSYSQESGTYSIDLDCFPDSQEVHTISLEYTAKTETEYTSQAVSYQVSGSYIQTAYCQSEISIFREMSFLKYHSYHNFLCEPDQYCLMFSCGYTASCIFAGNKENLPR